MRGEILLTTTALVLLLTMAGLFLLKKAHNDTPPVEHQLECTQKGEKAPDCKCDVLEAGKVIIK